MKMPAIPTLSTARLTLRAQNPSDFDAYADFYASDRSWGMGGPIDRPTAWRLFAAELGHWQIRGYGFWMAEITETGETLGQFGFWHPDGWTEVEIGWSVFGGHEGKGYAYEATHALRSYAYNSLGWGPLSSVIYKGNTRSEKLAERLGARPEREWLTPTGKESVIWRHPGVEAHA